MKNNYKNPIILYNPKSAGGRGREIFKNYYDVICENKLFEEIETYETKSKIDTINKVVELHKKKENDLIISLGGDGSISTICNGLMKIPKNKRLPLFPIPSGSGNSLLRDFNIFDVHDAIRNYKNEDPKIFDVMLVEEIEGNFKWYCINVLGMGFVSDIADYVVNEGKKFGAFSYVLGTVLSLGRFKKYNTVIKYDKGKKEFKSDKVFYITLSNTKYTGGKILVAPEAEYDDGLIDVVILYDINRLQFLNGFRKTFEGKHIHDKGCLYFKTNSLEIHSNPNFKLMPDGELEGSSPIKVSIIKKELKLIV